MNEPKGTHRLHLRTGSYFEHRGRFAEAKRWYLRAAKTESPEAEYRIGNLEYRSENYELAATHLKKAVAAGAGGFEAVKRLAISLERLGDRYGAEDVVRSELEGEPGNAQLRELLDSLQTRNGQHELQQQKLEKADSAQSDRSGARSGVPGLNSDDPAWLRVQTLSAHLDNRREDAAWLYNYGAVLEEAGRLHEAAHIFDEACALSSSSWWRYRCGRAYELAGHTQSARARYKQAIDNDRKFNGEKWGIGAFHQEARCWDLAASAFEDRALDTSDTSTRAELFHWAGHSHLLALDLKAAERCLRRALGMRPANVAWTRMLADTIELTGKFSEAADILDLLSTSEDLSSAEKRSVLWAAGRVHFQAGNPSAAISRLRGSLRNGSAGEAAEAHPEELDGTSAHVSFDIAPLFQGSTDRQGHAERARIVQRMEAASLEEDCLRKAEILSRTNDLDLALTYSDLLVGKGQLNKAAEVLLRTQVFWGPHPDSFLQPQQGTYAYQLAAYTEWRSKLPCESDVILYETNLGLSVDCNPLALCRHLLTGDRRYLHVWAVDGDVPVPEDLLESSDVLVVQKDSLQYTRLLATAKYLVNNSTFPTYFVRRDDQKYLMTWHGTPLKTLGKDMQEPLVHLNMARNYLQATHAIFPNEHTRRVLIEGTDVHGLLSADVQVTGYPRNDALFSPDSSAEVPEQGATVLYAPTWREDSKRGNQVKELLQVRDAIVAAGHTPLLRAHHYVESAAIAADPDISFVPRRIPTNDLLPEVDILVTDFSSIYFDYAITGRPIVLYTPDWDQYAETRGVYFSKDHYPGPVCDTIDQLRLAFSQLSVDMEARRRFLEEFAPMDDGTAAERVSREFFGGSDEEASETSQPGSGGGRGVLLRQAFTPNGMTSSFINLVTTVSVRGMPVTVLTDGRMVQEEPERQGTLARLPADVRVVGRVGMQPKTLLQYHASIAASKLAGAPSDTLEQIIDNLYLAEARRVLPVGEFSTAIEFDGYSEFMARLVLAIGKNSASTAIYLHSDMLDEIRLRMPQLKGVVEVLPKFDNVVAVSEGGARLNAKKLGDTYGIDTSRFTHARNLILPESIRGLAGQDLPDEDKAFAENREMLLVQVGRLSPEKNHMFTLDVVAALRARGIECKLIIVGDGLLRPAVERRIEELELEGAVHLTGWLDNPYPYIALADVMMLPSHHEGQPMVILEAQTLGTPVVGSAIPGLEAMGSAGPGTLLPLDVEVWSDALASIPRSRDDVGVSFDSERYVEDALDEFLSATDAVLPSAMSSASCE